MQRLGDMYTRSQEQYRIPKDRSHIAWFVLGLIFVLIAAVLIVGGFVIADKRAPTPTELDATGTTLP